ncbi:MAG: T9SS type A sorting domain-containing protein [Bacteroidales bacterium]|nr:T9SS type A sorting domain-containing protein [Bacteroidales bacterium]
MKRLFIILFALCLITSLHAQQKMADYQNADTTNLLKPELFNYDCNIYDFEMGYKPDLPVTQPRPYYEIFNSAIMWNRYRPVIDLAQPYHAGNNIAIKSVVLFGMIDTLEFYGNGPEYVRILDENFNTLIEARYDTISNPNGITMFDPIFNFIEITFDSTIVVSGDFYVNFTLNNNCTYDNATGEGSGYQPAFCFFCLAGFTESPYVNPEAVLFTCTNGEDVKYPLPRLRFKNDSTWYQSSDLEQLIGINTSLGITGSLYPYLAALSFYPKIDTAFDWATWNAQNSALNEIQEREKQINIFPNPAKDKITIESATEFECIEIKNLLGITQKSLKVKGNKVTVTISDLEKGTYLVSIKTSEGNHTKKIVKE